MDRLLQNNTVVKIIAGLLAILLWLTVHSGEDTSIIPSGTIAETTQQIRDKPVTVLYDEHQFSLVGQPKVTLTLHGSYLDVMNATFADSIKVIADATKLGEGVHDVPVFFQGQPKGVSIDDAKVTIRLEANTSNQYTVKVNTLGHAKTGYEVGDAVVTPKFVFASGAQSAIDAVDSIVANVSLDNASDSIRTSVPLTAVDKNGTPVQGISLSQDRVDVNIPINKPSKSVALRLQFKGELATGYAVDSVNQTNSVTVFGTAKALSGLDSFPAPVIDLTGLTKTTNFNLTLTTPTGITSVQPQQVQVTVNVVPSTQRTFTAIPLKVNGLTAGQSYNLESPSDTVQVTVEGAKDLIDKLTDQDISAFVDLTNQPAGDKQDVAIQVNTPNFIKLVSIQPQTITMNVNK